MVIRQIVGSHQAELLSFPPVHGFFGSAVSGGFAGFYFNENDTAPVFGHYVYFPVAAAVILLQDGTAFFFQKPDGQAFSQCTHGPVVLPAFQKEHLKVIINYHCYLGLFYHITNTCSSVIFIKTKNAADGADYADNKSTIKFTYSGYAKSLICIQTVNTT